MKLLILYLLCWNMADDPYYVCHITGKVKFAATKKSIRIGDKVHLNDSLLFPDAAAKLAVVNSKGMFIINHRKVLPGQRLNEVLLIVKEHLVPATNTGQLYTRGEGHVNNPQEMQAYLRSITDNISPNLLLVNEIRISINKRFFSEKDKKYFYLRYTYRNETINKKLGFREPLHMNDPFYLIIDRNIYTVDNKPVDPAEVQEIRMYYYDAGKAESVLLNELSLIPASPKDLEAELKVVIENLGSQYTQKNEKAEGIRKLIYAHLCENYGWIDPVRINDLFPNLLK